MKTEKTYWTACISQSMKKLSFIDSLKKRIPYTISLAFLFASLWMLLSPAQVFAETKTTGAINAGTGSGWLTSTNITASDSKYALQPIGSVTSTELKGTNYNFDSIPEGAVINLITVTINRYASIKDQNNIRDYGVYLVNKQGNTILSTNKAKTKTDWSAKATTATYTWTSADLSKANLALNDLKSPNFGAALSVIGTKSTVSSTAYVDTIQIDVNYTTTSAPSSVLPSISLDSNVIKANVNNTSGKMYFLSIASVIDAFKLIECGVVMSKDISDGLNLNNKLSKLEAPKQSVAGQFYSAFNVTYDRTIYVRSYIVYEDANGIQGTNYSNIIEATMNKQ
jgi:hypothetical protein